MTQKEKNYHELLHRLEPHQQSFVSHYLVSLNGTKAAKQAGYSERSAKEIGYENLTKPHIAEAIQAGTAMILERCEVTAERIVKELAAVGFSNVGNYQFDSEGHVELIEDAPSTALAAIASVKRKRRVTTHDNGAETVTFEGEYRLWDKLAALTLLGRKLRMWVDRVETESPQDTAYKMLIADLKKRQATEIR